MDQETAMQAAADHFAKAEEMTLAGSPQSARLHIEHAKGYVAMARELRIGRNRHGAYIDVWLPKVVLSEHPLSGDDVDVDDVQENLAAVYTGEHDSPDVATWPSEPTE